MNNKLLLAEETIQRKFTIYRVTENIIFTERERMFPKVLPSCFHGTSPNGRSEPKKGPTHRSLLLKGYGVRKWEPTQ